MKHSPVLIVGAGPSGLALALWLTKIGIKVRIIDRLASTLVSSRAIVVHSRTLEFYRQLGIVDELLARSFRFPAVNLWVNRAHKARFALGQAGEGLTPFPYVVIFPQDEHEKLLLENLKKLGVEVERPVELLSFKETDSQITAQIKHADGQIETCSANYLAGCDGSHSVVRKQLEIGFEGSTYSGMFYVADVIGSGPVMNGELHASLDKADFMAVFPMKQNGHARIIGSIQDSDNNNQLEWKDINPRVFQEMKIQVDELRWFSTYRIHHRVASQFQKGHVFLLGDAGHVHSPLGGQGMNTGIGDSINLAWKLGEVLKGRATESLLATYEPERISFARQLVATTDRAFQFVSSPGILARVVRTKLAPILLPLMFKIKSFRQRAFRTVSQTGISYRKVFSPSTSSMGLKSGDRLPWISSVDNFKPLQSLNYQIHIYGKRNRNEKWPAHLPSDCEIYEFPWTDEMGKKGLNKDKGYLIRPDGHLA